ncbi:MAG TPA: hypothetical protein VLF59_03685 [Candidatus Saccharimonadales bacterium]|nr:hypothetical protein [Candidatus Saccharimonadales bacterium]
MRVTHHIQKQVHHKLRLQHHTHTGRLLHHRHTSYRGLAIVLVLAGMCMGGLAIMQRAAADELLGVAATVRAPVPILPATITIPEDGTRIVSNNTTVAGSCPIITPQVIVEVDVDGQTAGTATCDANNDFAMPLNLPAGTHELTTRTFTITDDTGPASDPVHFTVAGTRTAATNADDQLASVVPYLSLSPSRTVTWNGTVPVSPGTHILIVNWGDTHQDTYNLAAGSQQISHQYSQTRGYNAVFIYQDSSGNYHQQQYAVAAYTTATGQDVATLASADTATPSKTTLLGIYGLYITMLALFGIVRLHATPFAFTELTLHHHAQA